MSEMKVCKLIEVVKTACAEDCSTRGYPALTEIFGRGTFDQLVLRDVNEAYMVLRYAALLRADAELKYPYWSDGAPFYNEAHEDAYQDVQMGNYSHLLNAIIPEFKLTIPNVVDPEFRFGRAQTP